MTLTRESAASAKPAARTAIRRLNDLDESMSAWIRGSDGENTCTIKDEWVITGQEIIGQAIKALEAQPAAERTALKELRKLVENNLYDLRTSLAEYKTPRRETSIGRAIQENEWFLTEIDAQERAGAKA